MGPFSKLDRRRWLRQTALGAIGGGLVVATATGQQPEREGDASDIVTGKECPLIMSLSKNGEGRYSLAPIGECRCKCEVLPGQVTRANYEAKLQLVPGNDACDETQRLLPRGSRLVIEKGAIVLREARCSNPEQPVWIGANHGLFRVFIGDENEHSFEGTLCGTEGFLPSERESRRCCAERQGQGTLCGEGLNKFKSWRIFVSYHSILSDLGKDGVCGRSLGVAMKLDGVLIGPCKRIDG